MRRARRERLEVVLLPEEMEEEVLVEEEKVAVEAEVGLRVGWYVAVGVYAGGASLSRGRWPRLAALKAERLAR